MLMIDNPHTHPNTNLEINNNNKDETRTPSQQTTYTGKKCMSVFLLAASFFGALGTSFPYGYNISVVNAPRQFVQEFYNHTWIERYEEPLGEDRTTILWSITVSIYSIGGIIGTVLATVFTQIVGRKGTLLLNNCFSLAAAVLLGASEKAGSFEMMIIGRLVMGVHAGTGISAISIYLAEISPRHIRGSIGIINGIMITTGVFSGQVLSLPELLGLESRWNFLFAFVALPAVLQLVVLPFLPESPRFLLMQKKDEAAAEKSYKQLFGKEDVSKELAEVHAETESQVHKETNTFGVWELLKDRAVRWQIISACIIRAMVQLCGINALFYYTDAILRDAGIDDKLITDIVLSTGATQIIFSVISGFLIERMGRRQLFLMGYGGMAGSYALLTLFLNIQDKASWIPYLSFISILLAIAAFSLGIGGLSFIVTSELFEQAYRPAAFLITGILTWLCSFIVGLVFPYMQEGLQSYVFLVFMVLCSATFIYIFIVIPETKNKTFVEISGSFAKRNKVPVPEAAPEAVPSGQ